MIILGSVLKLCSYWSPVLVSGKKCQNTLTALVLEKCRRPFAGFFGHFKKTKASQVVWLPQPLKVEQFFEMLKNAGNWHI